MKNNILKLNDNGNSLESKINQLLKEDYQVKEGDLKSELPQKEELPFILEKIIKNDDRYFILACRTDFGVLLFGETYEDIARSSDYVQKLVDNYFDPATNGLSFFELYELRTDYATYSKCKDYFENSTPGLYDNPFDPLKFRYLSDKTVKNFTVCESKTMHLCYDDFHNFNRLCNYSPRNLEIEALLDLRDNKHKITDDTKKIIKRLPYPELKKYITEQEQNSLKMTVHSPKRKIR